MAQALVLLGHGARDPEWARPFHRLQAALRTRLPAVRVEAAYMEFMAPALDTVVAGLAAAGVRRIRVLPVFISQGGHVRTDVREQVAAARTRWPDVRIDLLTAIGEVDGVLEAIADYAVASMAEGPPPRG